MVDQPHYLTPEGLVQLEERLENLKTVRRPQVAERLRTALEEGGDLTENAEYEDAKNEQAFLEGEILRLETIVNSAEIIKATDNGGLVVVGSKVTVVERGTKDEEMYHIVGSAEANPAIGKISLSSPMGQALLGAKLGDKVKVKAPDGVIEFKIKAIE